MNTDERPYKIKIENWLLILAKLKWTSNLTRALSVEKWASVHTSQSRVMPTETEERTWYKFLEKFSSKLKKMSGNWTKIWSKEFFWLCTFVAFFVGYFFGFFFVFLFVEDEDYYSL